MLIPRRPRVQFHEAQPTAWISAPPSKVVLWDVYDSSGDLLLAAGVEAQTAFEAYQKAHVGLSFSAVRVRLRP